MPVQYQSDPIRPAQPVAQTNPKPMQPTQQAFSGNMTPGGLQQSTGNPNYTSNFNLQGPGSQQASSFGSLQAGMSPAAAGGGWSQGNANRTQWNTDYGPIDTGIGAFNQFADSAYQQGLTRLQPQIDQANRDLQGKLVARGLEPGTAAFQAAMDQQGRTNNDMHNSLNAAAQAQGLAAQNQYFGQEMANNNFGLQQANQNWGQESFYDNLDNQRGIAGLSAAASMAGSAASAAASRYSADQQNYRAGLNYDLGLQGLNEQGRQFNATDAYRNQQLDANTMLGMGSLYNQSNQINTQNFLAQQQANNNWYGQGSGLVAQAPGAQYTPIGGTANQMIGLGQARANANVSMWGDLTSAGASIAQAIPWSDIRLKENIKFVGTENGVDMFEFEYKDKSMGDGRYRGAMAHLVKRTSPSAVIDTIKGMMVDYTKLPVEMTHAV